MSDAVRNEPSQLMADILPSQVTGAEFSGQAVGERGWAFAFGATRASRVVEWLSAETPFRLR